MSRSFKKQPFQSVCGGGSAKHDKVLAHRGVRRAHRRTLHLAFQQQDFENFLLPHRHECAWNEVYSWGRDGNQNWCGLDGDDWARYVKATSDPDDLWYEDERYCVWPPTWYTAMMRK